MEFRSLPFGIAIAPRIFTRLMKVPIDLLRRLGIRLIIYLDDILMSQSRQDILSDLSTVLSTLEGLGFLINRKKSIMEPSYNGVSRLYGGLDSVNSVSPTGKGEQNKRELQTNVGTKESLGKRHGSVDRPINSNESSRSSWPIALQKSSNFENKGLTLGGGGHYDNQIHLTQEVQI